MDKVQYYHGIEQGYTAAVEVDFESEDLLYLLKTGQSLFVQVGFSFLHPNDNYNKKIGRTISNLNKKETELKLLRITDLQDGEHLDFEFTGGPGLFVCFKTSRKSKRPHMIFASSHFRPSY
jgi:hypothetical protein